MRAPRYCYSLAVSLLIGLTCSSFQIAPGRSAKVQDYITRHRYLADEVHESTGIPLAIIYAVAGLESDWGSSELALMGNNHFGIKSVDWSGPVHCKITDEWYPEWQKFIPEYHCFRKYNLIREGYLDFGRFLTTRDRYRQIFFYSDWDFRYWAIGLQSAGYATDPNYADKLIGLIVEYGLNDL